MLTSLRLTNFKSFGSVIVPFGPFTVLLGPNATGKSNIRDALRVLHGISRGLTLIEVLAGKWTESSGVVWKGIRGGPREAARHGTDAFGIEARFVVDSAGLPNEVAYRIDVGVEDPRRGPQVRAESLYVGDGLIFDSHPPEEPPTQEDPFQIAVRLPKGGRFRRRGASLTFVANAPVLSQIRERVGHEHPDVLRWATRALLALLSMSFLDLATEAMRVPSMPGQISLGDHGENLSSVVLAACSDAKKKQWLLDALARATGLGIADIDFPADGAGRVLLHRVASTGERISAHSASAGTLRLLAMIAALTGPEPSRFYFFEEIEHSVHPPQLALLLSIVDDRCARGMASQFVVTSHSPVLVDALGERANCCGCYVYRPGPTSPCCVRKLADIPGVSDAIAAGQLGAWLASGHLAEMTRGLPPCGGAPAAAVVPRADNASSTTASTVDKLA